MAMTFTDKEHIEFMNLAIAEGETAEKEGEVPVGAVIVSESGELLAAAHNQTIGLNDPTAHSEILALRKAAVYISNYRLLDTYMYVTIEPCLMCMGAIVHSRVKTVVFGTSDSKWGAAGSLYDFAADKRLNHHPTVISGVCKMECRALIQNFFRARRKSIASNGIIP